MKKVLIGLLCLCIFLCLFAGCNKKDDIKENETDAVKTNLPKDEAASEDKVKENGTMNPVTEEEIVENDFGLISKTAVVELNMDISKVDLEPVSVEYGAGDGFKWTIYKYADIEIKTLLSDSNNNMINKITTKSPMYKTTRGIGVGDSVEELTELYKEYLTHFKSTDNDYYMFDPEDDLGFKKIYFYIENDLINQMVIEDGIDG